jgi:hypothetical protein
MSIPMFITFTKPDIPKYETLTFICSTEEECYNKLIINIKNNISKEIDYPADLDDFTNLFWYNNNYMDNNIFEYKIFKDTEWVQPWTYQELYDSVVDIIHNVDIQNSIYNDKNYYDYCSDSDNEDNT